MGRITVLLVLAFALLGISGTNALAQPTGNPFSIDGTITDTNNSGVNTGLKSPPCDYPQAGNPNATPVAVGTGACKQIDANDNTQELGPENGDGTKIGVIHNAHIKDSFKQQGSTVNCLATDQTTTVPLPAGCYQAMLGSTNPNAQVDLNATWIQSYIHPTTKHVYLYFAWRRDSASGSGFISLELQHARAGGARNSCAYDSTNPPFDPSKCNPWGGRQPGDILFLWDQQGNSPNIIQAVFTQGPVPPQSPTAAQLGYIKTNINVPDCSHTAECTVLDSTKAFAVYGTDCGTGFVANQCGEMVIDLTAIGVFPDPTNTNNAQCTTIANFIPGTVTGNSNTADYKDVVLAPFPPVSNCGSLKVTKVTQDAAGNQIIAASSFVFGYKLTRKDGAPLRYRNNNPAHPEDGVTSTSTDLVEIKRPNTYGTTQYPTGQPGLTGCVKGVENPAVPCGGAEIIHTELIANTDYRLVEDVIPTPWMKVSIVCTVAGGSPITLSTDTTDFTVDLDKETTCVITNKFQAVNPTADSYQRVMVADSVRILGILKGGTSLASPALARNTVRIYLFEGACGPVTQNTQYYDLTLSFQDTSQGSATETGYTSGFSTGFAVQANKTIYWALRWDGDTFNNGMAPDSATATRNTCNAAGPAPLESVTIGFAPTQSATAPTPGPQ